MDSIGTSEFTQEISLALVDEDIQDQKIEDEMANMMNEGNDSDDDFQDFDYNNI